MRNFSLISLTILSVLFFSCKKSIETPDNQSGIIVFGGTNSDHFRHIAKDAEGNMVLFGLTNDVPVRNGSSDLYVVKVNSNGQTLWEKTISNYGVNLAMDVECLPDGSIILLSYTDSALKSFPMTLRKLSADGNLLWRKDYNLQPKRNFSNSISITNDGGFILSAELWVETAIKDRQQGLLKLNAKGDIEWHMILPTRINDRQTWPVRDAAQLPNGSYIGLAEIGEATNRDLLIFTVSAEGIFGEYQIYGGGGIDKPSRLKTLPDGGFVVSAIKDSKGNGQSDIWLLRFGSNAALIWEKAYGEKYNDHYNLGFSLTNDYEPLMGVCSGLAACQDGGFAIATSTENTFSSPKACFLLKVDANGNELWSNKFGGYGSSACFSITEMQNGGLAAVGFTTSFVNGNQKEDAVLWLTDKDGNLK